MKRKKRDWSRITDERCLCGHNKSLHAGLMNHLECNVRGCHCTRFSWKCFLDKNGKKVA